jgi:hypothetical protein
MLLAVQIKCWAKAQCINDPKLGTLNSYALSLLVVFHLQVSGFLFRKANLQCFFTYKRSSLILNSLYYTPVLPHDTLVVKRYKYGGVISPPTLQYPSKELLSYNR